MHLSTRTRYGMHLMLALARQHGEKPVELSKVANNENISAKYLSLIVIPLKAAGLIRSVRGAKGGYYLTKKPEKISVREIVQCLEGEIHLVSCVRNPNLCANSPDCSLRKLWKQIEDNLLRSLNAKTLQDLMDIDLKQVNI